MSSGEKGIPSEKLLSDKQIREKNNQLPRVSAGVRACGACVRASASLRAAKKESTDINCSAGTFVESVTYRRWEARTPDSPAHPLASGGLSIFGH